MSIIKKSLLFCIIIFLMGCTQGQRHDSEASDLQILDSNGDGLVNPYEAFDRLLLLQKEHGNELSLKDIQKISAEYNEDDELEELIAEMDTDKNGVIELKETEGEMLFFAEMMDTDKDGIVTIDEVEAFNFEVAFLASEEEIDERIKEIFDEYNVEAINIAEAKKEDLSRFSEQDKNRDGVLTKEEAKFYRMADNTPISFSVKGKTAFMTGVITAATPATVLELLFNHPEVDTIEMIVVPGSIDDEANLRAALYVNKYGISTKLNSQSSVASGGTDFFLAGIHRIVEEGASIGVHSWGGGGIPATEVPKDDEAHQKYLDFYNAVGVPEEFYWYTLEAALADEIHIMNEAEIEKYNFRTEK